MRTSAFDENIDVECIPLIIALNNLKGVETYESCCGHLIEPFRIWFRCNDFNSLAIITRTFDKRYSDGKWRVVLETDDIKHSNFPCFSVCLESVKPFNNWKEMLKSINNATYYLNSWHMHKEIAK